MAKREQRVMLRLILKHHDKFKACCECGAVNRIERESCYKCHQREEWDYNIKSLALDLVNGLVHREHLERREALNKTLKVDEKHKKTDMEYMLQNSYNKIKTKKEPDPEAKPTLEPGKRGIKQGRYYEQCRS